MTDEIPDDVTPDPWASERTRFGLFVVSFTVAMLVLWLAARSFQLDYRWVVILGMVAGWSLREVQTRLQHETDTTLGLHG